MENLKSLILVNIIIICFFTWSHNFWTHNVVVAVGFFLFRRNGVYIYDVYVPLKGSFYLTKNANGQIWANRSDKISNINLNF